VAAGQRDGGGEVGGCVAATFGGDVSAWVRPLYVGCKGPCITAEESPEYGVVVRPPNGPSPSDDGMGKFTNQSPN
jgi:hypothetical protein